MKFKNLNDNLHRSIQLISMRLMRERGKTAILIAHRLSSVQKADKIVVLENGKVVEEGSHHSLLKTKNQYYSLWKSQFPELEATLVG